MHFCHILETITEGISFDIQLGERKLRENSELMLLGQRVVGNIESGDIGTAGDDVFQWFERIDSIVTEIDCANVRDVFHDNLDDLFEDISFGSGQKESSLFEQIVLEKVSQWNDFCCRIVVLGDSSLHHLPYFVADLNFFDFAPDSKKD